MVAAKTEGGVLYIGGGARGLGGGAKPEAAAASCSRRTPAAWAWLRLGLGPVGQARIFLKKICSTENIA